MSTHDPRVVADLTAEQIQSYRAAGYLVVERFLSEADCDRCIDAADALARGHFANMLDLHLRSPVLHELLLNPAILAMADTIQAARMIPIGSIFYFCRPDNPLEAGSTFHQDNYAVKAPFGSYFTCGVAFDDADEGNGALVVFPKTHSLGDLPNTPSKNFEFDANGRVVRAYPVGNAVQVPPGYEKVQLRYPKGSLIFLHGHVIHGAPRNASPSRWRRQIYLHYIKDGDPFWPGWNARRRLIDRA